MVRLCPLVSSLPLGGEVWVGVELGFYFQNLLCCLNTL